MSLFISRLLVLLMPFAPALMMAEESAADEATPTPLAELLEQLPKVAAAGRGMDANEEALAHAFARHGRALGFGHSEADSGGGSECCGGHHPGSGGEIPEFFGIRFHFTSQFTDNILA